MTERPIDPETDGILLQFARLLGRRAAKRAVRAAQSESRRGNQAMPIFKLEPVAETLNDPLWAKSPKPHEACYVGAQDERQARSFAYSVLQEMQQDPKELKLDLSPWGRPDFTTCTRIHNFGDDMPEGMVYRESELKKK